MKLPKILLGLVVWFASVGVAYYVADRNLLFGGVAAGVASGVRVQGRGAI
jgi:hypothetical protein